MWGKSSLRVEGGAQELVLSYSLRHRMLYFLQNLLYYISYEVLEPRWHKLMQQLAHPSVKTVDDVRNLHMSFLSTVLKESLLTYGPLYKKLYQLISECAAFADRVQGTYLLTYLLTYLRTYLLTYFTYLLKGRRPRCGRGATTSTRFSFSAAASPSMRICSASWTRCATMLTQSTTCSSKLSSQG